MASMDLLSYENPVFRGYITWGGLLLWKMMFMAPMTGLQRFRTKVSISLHLNSLIIEHKIFPFKAYENPEDVGATGEIRKDEAVERVRRAHLNDLETIPAFLFAAFAYVLTDPHPTVALWLIRVAVIARIFHTIVS